MMANLGQTQAGSNAGAVDSSPTSPLMLQQTDSTSKEVALVSGIECVPCDPDHICRQCNARWNYLNTVSSVHIQKKQATPFGEMINYRRYRWYYRVVLPVVTAVVIAIIIALAIVFRPRPPSGIYKKGTGLVALDRGDESYEMDVFFQHASGQIRHVVLNGNEWIGGKSGDNVLGLHAPSPREGTPLMAVSYNIDDETTWKVIYIDSNGFIQESIGANATGKFPTVWMPGPLGLGQFKANPSSHTGLSVCKHMLWSSGERGLQNGSLVLFYGDEDGKNHMLTHNIEDTAWTYNHTFEDSRSDSGIECTTRGSEITDVWMINSDGHLAQASYNFNPESNSTTFPAGNWKPGIAYNGPIQVPTSISAIKYSGNSSHWLSNSTFVYFDTPGEIIQGINVDTSNRSRDSTVTEPAWVVSNLKITSGSKIASLALRTNQTISITGEHGQDSKVFLQFDQDPSQFSVVSQNFLDDFIPDNNGYSSEIGK